MHIMTTIRISEDLANKAKLHGKVQHRSLPKQIEYWAMIGKVAEENPDLPYSMIEDIIFGMEELKSGKTESYEFG